MELMILDKNFDILGPVKVYNSLIWTRRYYEPGVFELHVPIDSFDLISAGKYVCRNDRKELGVIRQVEYSMNEQGIRTACCKGYFAEDLLNARVINTPQREIGTPEEVGRALVDRYFINPAETGRKIKNIKLGPLNNVGTSIIVTTTGDAVGEKLYDIEKTQMLSHRLSYDYLTNDLTFEVWQGKDRTDEQTENSWAIFSDDFYNVKKASYSRDRSSEKNFAYIAGSGMESVLPRSWRDVRELTWADLKNMAWGTPRIVISVDLRQSQDEERRELYVDAGSLSTTYSNAYGTFSYTDEQYRAMLIQLGLEKLEAYEVLESVTSDVDPKANLVYGEDYDLGDLCIHRFTDIGIECVKRITEVREVFEGSKHTLSLTLGADGATSITKLIKFIKREVS